MSDSYDDYECKMQLAEHAWEVKTEHDRAVELGQAYERGWNAALAQRGWVGLTDDEVNELVSRFKRYSYVLLREVEAKLKEKNGG